MTGKTKRILGIDTSLRSTGVGVVEVSGNRVLLVESGTLKMSPKLSHSRCLQGIFDGISAILERTHPDSAAVEGAFFAKNANTAMVLGQARGVAIVACTLCGVPVYEYEPRRVKQALTGYGSADKSRVAIMVMRLLNMQDQPGDDETDALALALCHEHNRGGILNAGTMPI